MKVGETISFLPLYVVLLITKKRDPQMQYTFLHLAYPLSNYTQLTCCIRRSTSL